MAEIYIWLANALVDLWESGVALIVIGCEG